MPDDCKLVKLLREREVLEATLCELHDKLYSELTTNQKFSLGYYVAAWQDILVNTKQIAVEEILHHEKVQAEGEIERDRIKLEELKEGRTS